MTQDDALVSQKETERLWAQNTAKNTVFFFFLLRSILKILGRSIFLAENIFSFPKTYFFIFHRQVRIEIDQFSISTVAAEFRTMCDPLEGTI